jgi:hypothetical protein
MQPAKCRMVKSGSEKGREWRQGRGLSAACCEPLRARNAGREIRGVGVLAWTRCQVFTRPGLPRELSQIGLCCLANRDAACGQAASGLTVQRSPVHQPQTSSGGSAWTHPAAGQPFLPAAPAPSKRFSSLPLSSRSPAARSSSGSLVPGECSCRGTGRAAGRLPATARLGPSSSIRYT